MGKSEDGEECVFWSDKDPVLHPHCFHGATDSTNDQESSSSERVMLSPNRDVVVDQEGDADSGEQSSPLGLKLRKTPSFLSLLQACLFKGKPVESPTPDNTPRAALSMSEKLKASNFPATLIRIGEWQRTTKHEGDLTAKLYYAKRKLVWEVLDGALKSKIEIQWSDITAIRAVTRQNEPGILEIQLNQTPLFYREINPQPRKHTLWQQASDFTGGQAPIWRRHYVVFPPGILDRHYEKLLLCDQRLFDLSQKPFPENESPYFDPTLFGLQDHSLSFNGYGPQANYLPGTQRYRSRLVPYSTLPVSDLLPFRHEGIRSNVNHFATPTTQIAWGNVINNSQSPLNNMMHHSQINYQQDSGMLNDIENHLLGESQRVGPESMGPMLEPSDFNVNYNANWAGTSNHIIHSGGDQVIPYWMSVQQPNDNGVMNYSTNYYSIPPFKYPDNPNNGDPFFSSHG